ncbi:4-coumarate--CoA ligase-like 6 [Platanthera zijinensis]|uniref:4-coumarate--CoA ligase n=1 Tax=Platanthera zijinensis TaxID=2320716 RepID=A0AAP0B3N7_9ASPA
MMEIFVHFEASQYEKESFEDVYLAAIPMFLFYSVSLFVLGLLCLGSAVVVMRSFDVQEAVKAIDRYKVTLVHLVPPRMAALVRVKDATGFVLSSLKKVSCGAAPLSQKRIKDFLLRFQHVDLIQEKEVKKLYLSLAAAPIPTGIISHYMRPVNLAPRLVRAQLASIGVPIVGDSMYMPFTLAVISNPLINLFGERRKKYSSDNDKVAAMAGWILCHGKEPNFAVGPQASQISWNDGNTFNEKVETEGLVILSWFSSTGRHALKSRF